MVTAVPIKAPEPSTAHVQPATSGLGRFDKLPVEVLYLLFEHLDFLSLARITRTARRGHELVTNIPGYGDILTHAKTALGALCGMQILCLHSIAKIRYMLRSAECISCGNFGTFLFLLECERVCWKCLSSNPAMWAISRHEAGDCFNLSAKQLHQLPCAHSIPGRYCVRRVVWQGTPLALVSVRAAKRLALQVHGSQEALRAHRLAKRSCISESKYQMWAHLHCVTLDFVKHDPCIVRDSVDGIEDEYNGMASVWFPYQAEPGGLIEFGRWCRGCKWTCANESSVLDDDVTGFFPSAYERATWLDLAMRERLSADFLVHSKRCYGLRQMLRRKQEGLSNVAS